jgi:hypothetical protein
MFLFFLTRVSKVKNAKCRKAATKVIRAQIL